MTAEELLMGAQGPRGGTGISAGSNTGEVPGISVRGLRLSTRSQALVHGLNLEVQPGRCLAIVGESGAGKSLTARALLGLNPPGVRVYADELRVGAQQMRQANDRQWRSLRGSAVALVSQDALVSLDPLRRIGQEVAEPIQIHQPRASRATIAARVQELLASVHIPNTQQRARQYPHQLSGGLRQRALIASALAGEPSFIIADEPTTALDATVSVRIVRLLRELVDSGIGLVLVTHDFSVVSSLADEIMVMHQGHVVESGPRNRVLHEPRHQYTRQLLAALVSPVFEHPKPVLADTKPLLKVTDLSRSFSGHPAVSNVSFSLKHNQSLGIVGESGSGKTTLVRMLLGVEAIDSGDISWFEGKKPRVQLVPQNPLGAFNPRWSIRRSLAEAFLSRGVSGAQLSGRISDALAEVGLDPDISKRKPAQLSGGQRQRAALARALAADPELLILDEPVSALDPGVRTLVLQLLAEVRQRRQISLIVISHDLGVTRALCEEVVVMQDSIIVESGAVEQVFSSPKHPLTKELVAAGIQ